MEDSGRVGRERRRGRTGRGPPSDYPIWQLQLPDRKRDVSDTVAPKDPRFGYSDIYYYKAGRRRPSLMDRHCIPRRDQRILDRAARIGYQWQGRCWSASATNTMTVTGKVLKGSGVTIESPNFNGGDSITLAELQYSGGGFTLFL